MIRNEMRADWEATDRVNREAFGGEDEARLVRRLRDDGLAAVSLVAVAGCRADDGGPSSVTSC